jgi:DNA-binding transcriptional LysR family regulator
LQVLVAERHVTRAADRLGLTQAKLSRLLAQLRVLTGDPLLVRTRQGMSPTPTGLELAGHARELLGRIQGTLSRRSDFDSASAEITFRIQAVDYLTATVVAGLATAFRRSAPGVKLLVAPLRLAQMRDALERRDADLVIGFVSDPPETLHISRLFEMQFACIAARDHPLIRGELNLQTFVSAAHVALSFGHENTPYLSERVIDAVLADEGLARRKLLELSSALAIPAIVAQSDLIATLPLELAKRAAAVLPLQVLSLPFSRPPAMVSMLWHPRSQGDKAHQWLRANVRKIAHADRVELPWI